ncbi:MAG: DUF1622 domain-containing protein [Proteobacteria bacterium]|nr:DUF1622 domain-containing protein [Pseudomonadota bacterium]
MLDRAAVTEGLEQVSSLIEIAGVAVILMGGLIATATMVRDGFGPRRWATALQRYRANLGTAILLGLELLIAADIIDTIALPLTFESVGLLAGVVLIRTFLSWTLEVEIEGRWPWQGQGRGAEGDKAAQTG